MDKDRLYQLLLEAGKNIDYIPYNKKGNKLLPKNKKGNKIHIKKENRGKFTAYCDGKVTNECIQRGLRSKDPKIRKRANFARNARKFKH